MAAKKVSLYAIFIALSVVGAFIKIPAIIGSVAFDAFPALFASVFIGGAAGAVVAFFGHFISALIGGMPLGPAHIIVALEMAVIVWGFGRIYKSGHKILATMFFVFFNGIVAGIPFIFIMSLSFYIALLPSLLIGALFNVLVALLFIPKLTPILEKRLAGMLN